MNKWYGWFVVGVVVLAPTAWGQLRSGTPTALSATAAADGTASDDSPNIAGDGAGTLVAVWHSAYNLGGTIGTDSDIFVTRSTDGGATWSSTSVLNSTASSDGFSDFAATVAAGEGGTWIAAWASLYNLGGTIGNDDDLFFARSTDNGATWGSTAVLNSSASADGSSTDGTVRITYAGDNASSKTWIAAWHSEYDVSGGGGTDSDILYARSTDDGATWSAPAHLNTTATTDGTSNDLNVSLASDGAGNVVAVWNSAYNLGGSVGTDNDIFVLHSSDFGATWSSLATLNSNAASDAGFSDFDPVVVTDGSGRWIASWRSQWSATGGDNEIISAYSSNNGATWSTATPLNSSASSDGGATDTKQRLAATGPNVFCAVWSSQYTIDGNSDYDVLVSVTDDGGATWSTVSMLHDTATVDGSSADEDPTVAPDGAGGFVAAWRSNYNLDGAIGTDNDILELAFTPDFTAPAAIAISPAITGPSNADSVDFTVTFDQDVFNFNALADLVITHSGTASTGAVYTGGPSTYTVTINGITGDGSFTVAASTASDIENGLGVDLDSSVVSVAVLIDNTAPGVTLSTGAGDPVGGPFTVNIATSEAASGLDSGDLMLTNATESDFSGSGDTYSFTLNPTAAGIASVSIDAGAFSDAAGNLGTASNVISRTFDPALPSVTSIVPSTVGPTNADMVDFTVTFDESVTGFDTAADVIIAHSGTAHSGVSILGGPTVYTVNVGGLSGEGSFTLAVNTASDVEDLAANPLSSSVTSVAVALDTIAPVFSNLTATPGTAEAGDEISLTFDTSETLASVPDLTVNGIAAVYTGNDKAGTYYFTHAVTTNDPLGPASIVVAGVDSAGNSGSLTDTAALEILAQVPVSAWPLGLALLAIGAARLRRPRR